MRFMMRVEITDVTEDLAVTWRPAARQNVAFDGYEFIPRDKLTDYAAAVGPAAGVLAFEALRIARGEARHGIDTDHRTNPNEAGWLTTAIHPDQGCYQGPESGAEGSRGGQRGGRTW